MESDCKQQKQRILCIFTSLVNQDVFFGICILFRNRSADQFLLAFKENKCYCQELETLYDLCSYTIWNAILNKCYVSINTRGF